MLAALAFTRSTDAHACVLLAARAALAVITAVAAGTRPAVFTWFAAWTGVTTFTI
jgi:hypothetical protein